MSLRQFFLLTAFGMMPLSGALHLEQEPKAIESVPFLSSGNFGSHALTPDMTANVKLTARTVEKVLKSANDPHSVHVTLHNQGSGPLVFMKWGTVFEEKISSRIIYTTPSTSSYLGYIVNRKPVKVPYDALITVKPGGEITTTVDLNQLMAFHEKGKYKVSVVFPLRLFEPLLDDDTEETVAGKLTAENVIRQMVATEVEIDVHKKGVQDKEEIQKRFIKHSSGGCTAAQTTIVHAASKTAVGMVQESIRHIEEQSDDAMYVSWLGSNDQCPLYDPVVKDRYDHLLKSTLQEYEADRTKGYTPDCVLCQDEMGWQYDMVYAYVYPTDPSKRVHMCGVFWTAPTEALKRDSQPGTIIHELSHFDDQFDTDDYAYGTVSIQALAQSDPCMARQNADNIEAYSEYVQCPGGATC